jgi:hypothetical protein
VSDFWLRKWYLDVADDRGNVYIGYWGQVRWKAISVSLLQHLFRTNERGVWSRSALLRQPEPAWFWPDELRWNADGVEGVWRSAGVDPLEERLLESDEGSIHWRCHQPRALVTVESADLCFSGLGYSETIEMTIPAWRLPIKTLFWGRAHSRHHSMVWIQWDGPTRCSRLWSDGALETEFAISESGVSGRNISLMVGENATLREGTVRSTVFEPYEAVTARFPAKALLFDEHKWYGTGQIFAGGSVEPATIIHEVVTW